MLQPIGSRPYLLLNEQRMHIYVAEGKGPLHPTNQFLFPGEVWWLYPPERRFVFDWAGKSHEYLAIPFDMPGARRCYFMADRYSEETERRCKAWRYTLGQLMENRSDLVNVVLLRSLQQLQDEVWKIISKVEQATFAASRA